MFEAIVTKEHSYRMPYSVGVRVPANCDLVFVAGTSALPLYHDHPHVLDELSFPEDPAAQTRAALEGVAEVLSGVNAGLEDIVRLDVFIADMSVQDAVARTLGEHFPGESPPAMTLIGNAQLVVKGLQVEMNAVAAIPSA